MTSPTRLVHLLRWLVTAGALLACHDGFGQAATNFAKVLMHEDGTRTESSSDLAKGELRESTFNSRNMLLSKRIVLLNEHGQAMQGVIYNGADELVGRVQFFYDNLGRLVEERNLNPQGKVFRRRFQLYDAAGNPLSSKIWDDPTQAPKIASNSINFTNVPLGGQPGTPGGAQPVAQEPKLPGQASQIEQASPAAKPPEQKKSFLKRLFGK